MKTGSSDLAASAETEVFAYFRPTQKEKIVQKAERDSLTMHKNDLKESSNFGEVVEAGGSKVQVLELESIEGKWTQCGYLFKFHHLCPLCFLLPQPLHQNLSSLLGHFCALLDYLFLLFKQFFSV